MNREDFPILKQQVHGRELVYLDNAATSQKPQQVLDAIVEAYSTWNSNIHRGVHHLSQVATMHHEEARKAVAQFINARGPEEIVFTKGTTDAINALAFSAGELLLNEGDEIIVSGDVGVEKPDREIFEIACERLGIAPAEAVYVGDNRKNDVDGALGAGMRAVWLAVNPGQRGKREPTAVIKDLRELPGVICGMRGAE